ncbi:MAG: zinc finger protein [Umezawaea sp.]
MTAQFRWFPHDGRRHAVPNTLQPLHEGVTLCGEDVTAPATAPPKCPDWCWPECATCDASWRTAEGLKPRPELPAPRTEDEPKRTHPKLTSGAKS